MSNINDWSTDSLFDSGDDGYEIRSYSSPKRSSRGVSGGRGVSNSKKSKKKKKSRLTQAEKSGLTAICCSAAILLTCLFSFLYLRSIPELVEGKTDIKVLVIYENGEEDRFEINTAEKYLGDALVAYGIATTDDHDNGNYRTINDITAQGNDKWVFSKNNNELSNPVNQTEIKDGETYTITYKKVK